MDRIKLKNFAIANDLPFTFIAGPCQMESYDHALYMAEHLMRITDRLGINLIYKSSFDKANRTSATSQRGVGLKAAMENFANIKKEFGCPIITDVHTEEQCAEVAEVVDILLIPAFLCRLTDLLKAAAVTGMVINVKKGQFLAPWDMKNVYDKLVHYGAKDILLTDRGSCFGYNNIISDMRGLKVMAETGAPVVFDATHSVQQPAGLGGSSGGERKYVETLARAAVSVGVAALFIETHQDPDNAPSDGPCMVKLHEDLEGILERLQAYDALTKKFEL